MLLGLYNNFIIMRIIAKHIFYLKGLSQNHQKTNGLGHNQKAVGEFVLLEWERMHSGFQYHVYQLLCLQQARRGCCSHGTGSRKIVSYKGILLITITHFYFLLNENINIH